MLTDQDSQIFEGHFFDHVSEDAAILLVEPDRTLFGDNHKVKIGKETLEN